MTQRRIHLIKEHLPTTTLTECGREGFPVKGGGFLSTWNCADENKVVVMELTTNLDDASCKPCVRRAVQRGAQV